MTSKNKWTPDQMNAILATEGSVLVSAAAGSGKTAVLTERVIEMISRKESPIDADRLLIVTFTNAASVEMRERISSRINELLSITPNDRNLQRQSILLTKASISTIHSFCSDLIREYFYKLNVSSSFRIADENEASIIRDKAIDNVLEKYYQIGNEDFHLVVETFSNSKNDAQLVKLIKNIYNFIGSHPYPDIWMEKKLSLYEDVEYIENSVWGKIILEYAKDTLSFCVDLMDSSIEVLKNDSKLYNSFSCTFKTERNSLSLKDVSCWDKVKKEIGAIEFGRLNTPRGYKDDPTKTMVMENRNNVKKLVGRLKNLFIVNSNDCKENLKVLHRILKELFSLVRDFSCEFRKLKKERNVVDFTDLEHLTAELLATPTEDGFIKTNEAVEISKRFDYVMVDEYQDTNETQDLIFRALSNDEKNLFVVGDVKQSIYGFRQAMPEIFLRRKESYKKYDKEKKEYPARIVLGNNFRSRKGVTDSVNFVFSQLMSKESGGIGYSDEDKLIASAEYDVRECKDTEICLIDLSESFSQDMDVVEAKYIADLIKEKIQTGYKIKDGNTTRVLRYSDCCVLLRSTKSHATVFVKELEKNGIPAWSESGDSFFSAVEIQFMISFLRVVDNPIQDVPLLSLLMSPFYMVSVEEISKIRSVKNDVPFYFALKEFADITTKDKKIKSFLDQLEYYRSVSCTVSSSDFINYVYDQTDFLSFVQTMKDGQKRLQNLRMLVDYAKKYEESGFKSVSDFVGLINKLQDQKSDLQAPSVVSEMSDAVRVMSIHRSKGLEFPVCIIANASRRFNKEKNDVLLHSKLGVGIKTKDENKLCVYTNFVREAVSLEIDNDEISEELRVLYVAMTRAKENLIVLCSFKDVQKSLKSVASRIGNGEKFESYVIRNAQSFTDWIVMCALKHKNGQKIRLVAGVHEDVQIKSSSEWDIKISSVKQKDASTKTCENNNTITCNDVDNVLLSKMKSRFEYEYDLDQLKGIPAKVSVSDLVHGFGVEDEDFVLSRPEFLNGNGITSVEKGLAVHAFLQFADFCAAKKSLDQHINDLVLKNFLTDEQSRALDKNSMKIFLNSDVANRIIKSRNVLREFRFNVNLQVNKINKELDDRFEKEYVVLQGAIDCAFFEDDRYVIVDYKTDKVSSMDELVKRYAKQLNLYKSALKECTKKDVSCIIYSFFLGKSSQEF